MGDIGGGIAGGCCAAICSVVAEAFQFQSTQSRWGANWCRCCDTLCHCKCCWDAGEFDPEDLPQNRNKSTQQTPAEGISETLPAYSKAEDMRIPNVENSNRENVRVMNENGETEILGGGDRELTTSVAPP